MGCVPLFSLLLPNRTAAREPHQCDFQVGQQVLEGFSPLIVHIESQSDGVGANLVALDLVWELKRWLGLVGDIILLCIHRELLQTLKEDTHGL